MQSELNIHIIAVNSYMKKKLTLKELIIGLGFWVVVIFVGISIFNSKKDTEPNVDTKSIPSEQENTQESSAIEQLSYEDRPTIENFTYLYTGEDKSEEYLKKLLDDIREANCKKPCNISLYDDRDVANLDKKYSTLTSQEEMTTWKQNNYVEVANHFPAMWSFEEIFFYYPYKDWYYDELTTDN